MLLVIAILLVLVLIGIARCIVIVPQSNAYVTEWLGVYKDTWGAGLHLRTPFVERVSRKVSLKEEAADFPPQPVITRDNVTMMIDTVVFFQVFDAKLFAYGVNRPIQAIENLSATTLPTSRVLKDVPFLGHEQFFKGADGKLVAHTADVVGDGAFPSLLIGQLHIKVGHLIHMHSLLTLQFLLPSMPA